MKANASIIKLIPFFKKKKNNKKQRIRKYQTKEYDDGITRYTTQL